MTAPGFWEVPAIGALLAGSPISEAVPQALRRLITSLGADCGAIVLADGHEGSDGWVLQGIREIPEHWRTMAIRAAQEGKPIHSERSSAVPLLIADRAQGVLVISPSPDPDRLAQESVLLGLGLAAAHKMAKMAEIDRLKGDFVSMISHELRTPITTIKGCLESIERGYAISPVAQNELVTMARKNTERLNRMIEDLLDVSRLESRKMVLRFTALAVEPIISGIVQSFEASARQRGIRLLGDLEPDLPHVWADEDRYFQAVASLVNNAVKFTSPGGTVRVAAQAIEDHVWVRVVDSGPGISLEDRQAVFGMFSQVDSSASRRHGGAGLGLYITREAVLAMKGHITVESSLEAGSVFSVGMPVARHPVLQSNHGHDVLVVDDDDTFVEFLRILLSREGYHVHSANTGLEGLKAAVRQQPSLILLDLMMPDLDGWGLLDYLQQGEETRSIPVMILSALRPDTEARRFRSYRYLEKSLHPKALIGAIREVLPPPLAEATP